MAILKFFAVACSLLALSGITTASPVKQAGDFHFKDWLNRWDCPMAGGTKYESITGDEFGILCGWDTHSRIYHWGPITDVDFEQCISMCAKRPECTVATFTGTCYLKKSARGKGYVRTGRADDMTAIKLGNHKNSGKGGSSKGLSVG